MGTEFGPSPEEMGLSPQDLQTSASKESGPSFSKEDESKVSETTKEIGSNLNLFAACAGLIKKYPQYTAAAVSAGIGVLSMAVNTPIPPEILTKISAGIGGAALGLGKESTKEKIAFGLGGAVAATGLTESAGHVMNENLASITANFIDDVPTAVAGLGPVVGKLVRIKRV